MQIKPGGSYVGECLIIQNHCASLYTLVKEILLKNVLKHGHSEIFITDFVSMGIFGLGIPCIC